MRAYRAGTVAIANAIGTGVADDKAIYCYVPEMIRFYLGEEPILENVTTYLLDDPEQLEHVLARLDQLVVKPTGESGGSGVVIGPRAPMRASSREHGRGDRTRARRAGSRRRSCGSRRCRRVTRDGTLSPRHVDLRPFAVFGERHRHRPRRR